MLVRRFLVDILTEYGINIISHYKWNGKLHTEKFKELTRHIKCLMNESISPNRFFSSLSETSSLSFIQKNKDMENSTYENKRKLIFKQFIQPNQMLVHWKDINSKRSKYIVIYGKYISLF